MITTRWVIATAAAMIAPMVAISAGPASALDEATTVYINEIHYDNAGADTGEAIEIAGATGTDLTDWSVVLYNGNGGAPYGTIALTGTIPDEGAGLGALAFARSGIQNGAPDGLALVDPTGTVLQFLSYEGDFAAVGGPADGVSSTDIGPSEASSTEIGLSLQRLDDGMWAGPLCSSFGELNDPAAPASCPIQVVADITEIHYDNVGTDTGEAVEVRVTADADLSGWSVVRYNGSNGRVYGTDALTGTVADLGGGVGVYVIDYPTNGLQNGAPDGIALVGPDGVDEFWSYEGVFEATDGPAAGMTSTDIVVEESSSTEIGLSLQRNGDDWSGPSCSSFGAFNDPAAPSTCEPPPPAPTVFFSELHYDNAGADANEAIEIEGPAGTDLTGWSIALYNGSNSSLYGTEPLSGTIPDLDAGTGVVVLDRPGLQNGAPDALALVDGSGVVVEFLSYEGALTAADGPAAGLTSTDIGVFEDGDTLADQSLQRVDGVWSGPSCASFGELNDPFAPAACPIEVKIHDIQGPGGDSPLLGQRVIVEGVVVGDEEGPAPALRGFFVQEEDADTDADPVTSEGVFVFNFDNENVNVGDLVRVEGTVEERFGNTQLSDFVEVDVLGTAPLPNPAAVTFPLASAGALEAYEGMSVSLTDTLVISEYFNYDRFGEVVVAKPTAGTDRVMNPTAVYDPTDPQAQALRDLNLLSRITIDDGNSSQNPDVNIHPINREPFSLANSFRGGDTVTGLTGPIYYSFDQYRILPIGDHDGDGTNDGYTDYVRNPAPSTPDDVGGDLRVATLNALNYFDTIDPDPDPRFGTSAYDVCGPNQDLDCRGADDDDEFVRQHVKLMNALIGLDADVVGLVEIENTFGVEALATIVDGKDGVVDGLNDILGAGTYDYVAAGVDGVVGGDAIKVGIIYRPAAVTPFGASAILDTPDFLDPLGTGSDRNRAAVAQSFVENASGEVFSVVVNHLKSKGSACGETGEGGLTGSCNLTRTTAAGVLADWLAGDPTGSGDADWLILGDLNSYDQESPIAALRDAGYTDLIGTYQGDYAYSYVFDGEVGYLDYAMSSPSMTAQVTGATEWHINADEPDIVDYDTGFKSDAQDAFFDPTTPLRASDHDAAVVGLSLSSVDVRAVFPLPFWLRATNHRLRDIRFLAFTGRHRVTRDVTVLAAMSSEADSGLGRHDLPGDIVIEDGELALRAEAFSAFGRTYTIRVAVADGDQVVVVDGVRVFVSGPWGWHRWY